MQIEKIESRLRINADTKLEAMELGVISEMFAKENIHFTRPLTNSGDEVYLDINLIDLKSDSF
jgi:hypothetical protein